MQVLRGESARVQCQGWGMRPPQPHDPCRMRTCKPVAVKRWTSFCQALDCLQLHGWTAFNSTFGVGVRD